MADHGPVFSYYCRRCSRTHTVAGPCNVQPTTTTTTSTTSTVLVTTTYLWSAHRPDDDDGLAGALVPAR